uniref:Uncharacterized protein n=1 Tax=Timema monikensis TaxID=170555 RepID=A0A7R9ECZ0_9NEOP|nr:unnamed protein product [Timema monikensis]
MSSVLQAAQPQSKEYDLTPLKQSKLPIIWVLEISYRMSAAQIHLLYFTTSYHQRRKAPLYHLQKYQLAMKFGSWVSTTSSRKILFDLLSIKALLISPSELWV